MMLGGEKLRVRLELEEELADLSHWRCLDEFGKWTAEAGGIVGEWVERSPSIFFDGKIESDFLWQVTAAREKPDEDFVRRFTASKWGGGVDPAFKYNFNFWLRADSPSGGDFFGEYPAKLGTGWNGMGDDHWRSYFTTVVRSPGEDWVRLRRSPGYVMVEDVHGVVPHLPYGEAHEFTFLLREGRVKMFFDDRCVYDHAEPGMYEAGYIGLCVWLARVRFSGMRLYRFD